MNILLFIFLNYIHFLYYLCKKNKKIFFTISTLPLPFLLILFNIYKVKKFKCDTWAKGLNNTYIDNYSKKYPCKILIPKQHSCYLSQIGPYFNFVEKFTPTCQSPKILIHNKRSFLNNLNKIKHLEKSKKNHFGYPLTNNEFFNPNDFGSISNPGNLSFEILINQKVILMDLYDKYKDIYYKNISKPEIEIVLEKKGGKIIFKIEKNETLIKEREKLINKNGLIYKNILIIFLDTLSRAHFYRKFPKTIKFFNQFSRYERNYTKKNITIFEFLKYHSLKDYTDPNLKAAYYGSKNDCKGIHFVNYFKSNGYIVGRVNTFCEKESVFYEKNVSNFEHGTWDHEGLSLGCISPFYDHVLAGRLSSIVRKCLFGRDLSQYSLDYLEQFWKTYQEQNKMFLFQSLDGHEPTGELIGYFDKILYNFLYKFYIKRNLKDTAIIIFSDHGQHLNGPFYLLDSQDYYIERSLPVLFLLFPNNEILYENNLYEKIRNNQQIFITPFDIYNTLVHLAFGKNNLMYKKYFVSFGESLLTELNYKERYCNSKIFDSPIDLETCKYAQILKNY